MGVVGLNIVGSHGGNTNFTIFAGDRYCVKLLSTEEYGLRPVGTAVDR